MQAWNKKVWFAAAIAVTLSGGRLRAQTFEQSLLQLNAQVLEQKDAVFQNAERAGQGQVCTQQSDDADVDGAGFGGAHGGNGGGHGGNPGGGHGGNPGGGHGGNPGGGHPEPHPGPGGGHPEPHPGPGPGHGGGHPFPHPGWGNVPNHPGWGHRFPGHDWNWDDRGWWVWWGWTRWSGVGSCLGFYQGERSECVVSCSQEYDDCASYCYGDGECVSQCTENRDQCDQGCNGNFDENVALYCR